MLEAERKQTSMRGMDSPSWNSCPAWVMKSKHIRERAKFINYGSHKIQLYAYRVYFIAIQF